MKASASWILKGDPERLAEFAGYDSDSQTDILSGEVNQNLFVLRGA